MTGFNFYEYTLDIPRHQIDIQDVYMCVKPKEHIMWLRVSEDSAKKVFITTAREKNPNLSITGQIESNK